MDWISQHPVAVFGTIAVLILGWLTKLIGDKLIDVYAENPRRHYRLRQLLTTLITLAGAALIGILWARLLQKTSTFLGLIGAGMAIALREPLLSLAARVAIFAGRIYVVGDRVEVDTMAGDVIDIGFVYTRVMEIGNWISGDQVHRPHPAIPECQDLRRSGVQLYEVLGVRVGQSAAGDHI